MTSSSAFSATACREMSMVSSTLLPGCGTVSKYSSSTSPLEATVVYFVPLEPWRYDSNACSTPALPTSAFMA